MMRLISHSPSGFQEPIRQRTPRMDSDALSIAAKQLMICGHIANGRNLVVCIDGTSNQFGEKNTNVTELYNLILKEVDDNQRTWYNSGIGTYAKSYLGSPMKALYHLIDLAFAINFQQTVLGAYRWLSDNYEKGDRVFLFGFSRGAFQVRTLSAMIDKVGLIYKGNEMQIPFAYELYADPKSGNAKATEIGSQAEMSMASRFKKAFSQDVRIHFVGAWDTVSSVGLVYGKNLPPGTVDGMKHVCYFRHALALDERRVKFLPEYAWGGSAHDPVAKGNEISQKEEIQNDKKSVKEYPHTLEVWFPGTHSDIGGGNAKNRDLNRSRPPLRWMVFEAEAAGLRTARFDRELSLQEQMEIKESLKWYWWPLEILPLKRLTFTREKDLRKQMTRKPHIGAGRKIHHGQKIHGSLLLANIKGTHVPRARLPKDIPPSFWADLSNQSEWVELDLYEYTENLVSRAFIIDHDITAQQALTEIAASNDGQQALYMKAVATFSNADFGLDDKCKLLHFLLNTLQNDRHLKLRPPSEIQPLLKDLLYSDNTDYQSIAKGFIARLTDPCRRLLDGHGSGVLSVTFLPNSDMIASGSQDKSIRIWNMKTGEQVRELQGHKRPVSSVRCSHDGNHIASVSWDETVHIWDVVNDSRQPKGSLEQLFGGHGYSIYSVDFSPDGNALALASYDGSIRLWDVQKREQVGAPFQGLIGEGNCTSMSSDGKLVVSGSDDGKIRIWDVAKGEKIGELLEAHEKPVCSVKFSQDGKYIVSGSMDKTVRIWDTETKKQVGEQLRGHRGDVFDVAFSHDRRHIISGSADRTVRIWDVNTGEQVGKPFYGHTDTVCSIAFSDDSDGTCAISGSKDGTVRVWDVVII